MLTLEDMPARCAAFRQLSSSRRKVRRLLSGEGHHIYWVYFTIIGDVVKVLHIRHCSRKPPAKL